MDKLLTDYELWQESNFRAFGGGSYFNPVAELVSDGRPLTIPNILIRQRMNCSPSGEATKAASSCFSELRSQLRTEETMFGVYRRGKYQLAPLLADAIDLVTYEYQVKLGDLTRVGYYAVLEETAERGLARVFP
jgi:hypothetical protein